MQLIRNAMCSAAALALLCPAASKLASAALRDAPRAALTQAATPNPNCTLIVPSNPLTAAGLATPYQLTATDPGAGPCHEASSTQAAFVQAAILDPASGQITIYNPLVLDKGTTPAAAPVVPKLPAGAVVGIWFGFDGDKLTLAPAAPGALLQGLCVNGMPGNVFGQFAYCNAPLFFLAADRAIATGKLKVPALGTAVDGKPCPTVRDFFVVDQDQSDNLPTSYLATSDGSMAQNTAQNLAALPGAEVIGNPSDEGLLDKFVAPALGCKVWTAPDLANPGHQVPALALNELQARTLQPTPVALVPAGDPMTQLNGADNRTKTNLYRAGADQPIATSDDAIDTARYCRQLLRVFPARFIANAATLGSFASPLSDVATNLNTFLAQRFVGTYEILNCATLIGLPDPVSFTSDANGIANGSSVDAASLKASLERIAPYQREDDAADSHARAAQLFN